MENNNRAPRSEAEEFNAFNSASSASAGEAKTPPKKPAASKPAKKGGINKNIIIAAVVGVLVLLLVAGIVVLALTREHHIMKEDNAFLVYTDSDNDYHLLSNGYEIEKDFEGEVAIEVAADNSFAYVTDTSTEGTYIYLLKGKKLEPLTTSAVDEVLCFASLKPGVIYFDNNKYRLFSQKYGEENITKDLSAKDFMISADGSTVVYTVAKKDAADVRELTLFKDGLNTTLNAKNNCIPAAVSNYGDFVYASFVKDDTQKLSVFTTKNLDDPQGEPIAESDGFVGVISMNVKGDELLFITSAIRESGEETSTKLYRYEKKGDQIATALAKAVLLPKAADPDIVFFDNFSDVYMTAYRVLDPTARAIYYLDNKYQPTRIASYTLPLGVTNDSCTIDPDGNFLYYINEDVELIQLDLTDDNYATKDIAQDVVEFYVTQKGNIYYLDVDGTLRFREASQRKSSRICDDVTDISFYRYSNTLFFTKEEGESIFSTKEGSDEDIVKMGDAQVTALPEFYNTNSKQSYAAYYDIDNGGILLYTSNGKRFKKITNDCQAINGDILSDNVGIIG
ncbi:MAG: hypothetical protein J6Q82_01650 [Clostridia bacterium]|nr:hypothetical protein [Clostridia bacterium]